MRDVTLVQLRVLRDEATAWRRAAREEERSVAALVRVAVREHLARQREATARDGVATDTAAAAD